MISANGSTSVQFDSKESLGTSHPATLILFISYSAAGLERDFKTDRDLQAGLRAYGAGSLEIFRLPRAVPAAAEHAQNYLLADLYSANYGPAWIGRGSNPPFPSVIPERRRPRDFSPVGNSSALPIPATHATSMAFAGM